MKKLVIGAMLSIALGLSGQAFSQGASQVEDLSKLSNNAPPMLGVHWARGADPFFRIGESHSGGGSRPRRTPNMTYHGGVIMPTAVTRNIFWGSSWGSYSGDEITGLDLWYLGFDGSNYAKTSDEYTGPNGPVGAVTTHDGHFIDTSAASGGNNTSAILSEVCKEIGIPVPNGYYSVYTDLPRGNSGYCAYHSVGFCPNSNIPVQFAFFWKLDSDPGCDPQDMSGLHSQGLAALANVSGHELSEARTDPDNPGAWYDSNGQENGDKCAWTFNVPLVTFSNGTQWKIQGEWSNAAFTAGTGYPNSAGQMGCLDGH
jgi:hypothetical protein